MGGRGLRCRHGRCTEGHCDRHSRRRGQSRPQGRREVQRALGPAHVRPARGPGGGTVRDRRGGPMITELLPVLQATPPPPLLEALDIGSPYVLHLAWTMTPPGRLCYLLTWSGNHPPQNGDHGAYHDAIAEAEEIVRTLTPDD